MWSFHREKWFPEINHHCPGTPFVLVGLKADLKQDGRDYVSYEEASTLARDLGKPISISPY